MRVWAAGSALSLAIAGGCAQVPIGPVASPAVALDATQISHFEASASIAVDEHRGVVRAVNQFGTAVPAVDHPMQLDGAPVPVVFDHVGYGSVLAVRGLSTLTGAVEDVELHTLDVPWLPPPLHPAFPTPPVPPTDVQPAHDGVAFVISDEVWWAGPDLASHRVLAPGAPIVGMRSRHADVDGLLDLLVWTDTTVFVLVGRLEGGYGHGGAWEAPGYRVTSADLGDLDGNRLPGVAVVWQSEAHALLDLWQSDGWRNFSPISTHELDIVPADVLVQDATARGRAQVTVIDETRTAWQRFVRAWDRAAVPIGPSFPPIDPPLADTMVLHPARDLNSDSGDDILFVDQDGVAAAVDVLTDVDACASGRSGAQCEPTVDFIAPAGGHRFAVGDGNADRIDDVWFLNEDRSLHSAFWLSALGERRQAPVLDLPGVGPFTVRDADLDGVPDLSLALSGRAWRWYGVAHPNDPLRMWSPRIEVGDTVRTNVMSHFAVIEVDGDPTTNEVVLFTHENVDTRLKVVQYTNGAGRGVTLGRYRLVIEKVPVDDLDMCGTQAWVVADGRAWRLDLTKPTDPTALGLPLGNNATRVDCRWIGGTRYGAYLEDGEVSVYSEDGGGPTVVSVPGALDFALVDVGGLPEVRACGSAGCSIVQWEYGDAGQSVIVLSDASGTTFDGENVQPHHGQLVVTDLNGDGLPDLLGSDPFSGLVFVHWSTGSSIAPVTLWHTVRNLAGPAQVGDADDDGQTDLWLVDEDGRLEWLSGSG